MASAMDDKQPAPDDTPRADLLDDGDVGVIIPTPDTELPPAGSIDLQSLELPAANFSLSWMGDVLRAAGLSVAETTGWRTRGHGDFGTGQGVLCHHTAGPAGGNMPSLKTLIDGRGPPNPLAGPIANLGLGRDGTYYVIAAGKAFHAGAGAWHGVTDGNLHFIGIEAENTGKSDDPWPAVQLNAYAKGVAALLKHMGCDVSMCAGHKEYALPKGRKDDPDFDMNAFRQKIAGTLTS